MHSKHTNFSLEVVSIHTTVFLLCILIDTHHIIYYWPFLRHLLSFSRFKNLLDLPVNVLKNMSSTDPWDVLCTAGANNFVSIIVVQKTKSCSLMPLMQPAVHFSCLLFSSKGMTFKWGKKMKMKNENTTWIPCPSVPYIILKKQ